MLNNAQKRHLRSLAHAKRPYVTVGSNGLTQAVLDEIESNLAYHELIKVRVYASDRYTRDELITQICIRLGTELVQRIGHTAVLFRRNPKTPRVHLP